MPEPMIVRNGKLEKLRRMQDLRAQELQAAQKPHDELCKLIAWELARKNLTKADIREFLHIPTGTLNTWNMRGRQLAGLDVEDDSDKLR